MQYESQKNIALLCNPLAGGGKALALAEKTASLLAGKKHAYTLYKDKWPDYLSGFTDVWIIGGDGTLHFFINHYPDIKQPLAIFNGGTGNDFHWLLHQNKSLPEQIETALTAVPHPVDAGQCNKTLFINGAGIGFEGAVVKSLSGKRKRLGKLSFLLTIIRKIFSYRSVYYSISTDEYSTNGNKMMIDVVNGKRAGGGFRIAPTAAMDDGRLDVVLINPIAPLKRLQYLPSIKKGKHLQKSFCNHFKTKKIIIESEQPMQAHLDGEFYTAASMEISILPEKFLFRY